MPSQSTRQRRNEFRVQRSSERFKVWRIIQRYAVQLNRCAYCRRQLVGPTIVDHVRPVSSQRNATVNSYANLVVSCRMCNLRKSYRTGVDYPEWVRRRVQRLRNYNRQELLNLSRQMEETCKN